MHYKARHLLLSLLAFPALATSSVDPCDPVAGGTDTPSAGPSAPTAPQTPPGTGTPAAGQVTPCKDSPSAASYSSSDWDYVPNIKPGDNLIGKGFKYGAGNPRHKVVNMQGRNAIELTLDRYKDANNYRTEMEYLINDTGFKDQTAIIGDEYRIGLGTLLPADFKHDKYNSPEIFMQFHDLPDLSQGEPWKSPPVSMLLREGKDGKTHYMLDVRSEPKRISNGWAKMEVFDLGPVEGDIGKWVDWEWRIKWAYDNTGYLELYRNGQCMISLPRYANAYNDAQGPYFKFGIYKWPWKENIGDPGVTSRTIYYSDLRFDHVKS